MRSLTYVAVSLLLVLVSEVARGQTTAHNKIALLIGNEHYLAPLRRLTTPGRNVEGMEQELKAMGFEVQSKHDLEGHDLSRVIEDFAAQLRPGDIGFFYFSGHGRRSMGRQYILPVDNSDGITVDWVSKTLGRRGAKAIFIVAESCTRGGETDGESPYDEVSRVSDGTFVVLPVQNDQPVEDIAEPKTGRSFFATKLLAALEQTCLDHSQAFQLLTPLLKPHNQTPQFLGRVNTSFSFWCPVELHENAVGASIRLNAKDGLTYSFIPGGEVALGCAQEDPNCQHRRQSMASTDILFVIDPNRLTRGCSEGGSQCQSEEAFSKHVRLYSGFWIGQTEVTVEAYGRVMKSLPASAPTYNPGWVLPKLPITMVTLDEATAYCSTIGGHIPSELEWEFAARRGFEQSVIYPWVQTTQQDLHGLARFGADGAIAPGANPKRWQYAPAPVAWFLPTPGTLLFDLAGNAAEWVEPVYAEPIVDHEIVRGGSWRSAERYLRLSSRLPVARNKRDDSVGFRCALPIGAPN